MSSRAGNPSRVLESGRGRPTPARHDDRGHGLRARRMGRSGESSADRPIAPLHRHLADDEAWYVLEGTLGFIRGEEMPRGARGRGRPGAARRRSLVLECRPGHGAVRDRADAADRRARRCDPRARRARRPARPLPPIRLRAARPLSETIHRISPGPVRKERRFSCPPPLAWTRPGAVRSSGTEHGARVGRSRSRGL